MICVYTARLGDYSAELAARYARALGPEVQGSNSRSFPPRPCRSRAAHRVAGRGALPCPCTSSPTRECCPAPPHGCPGSCGPKYRPKVVGFVPVRHREGYARARRKSRTQVRCSLSFSTTMSPLISTQVGRTIESHIVICSRSQTSATSRRCATAAGRRVDPYETTSYLAREFPNSRASAPPRAR